MTKQILYPPHAVLFEQNGKDDQGRICLVGTDPQLADATQFFRWANEPGGWENRKPWPPAGLNATRVDNKKGLYSGWPGAVRVPAARPPGRPRSTKVQSRQRVSIAFERSEIFEIMRRAAAAEQSISEWIVSTVRNQLSAAPVLEPASASSPPPEETTNGG